MSICGVGNQLVLCDFAFGVWRVWCSVHAPFDTHMIKSCFDRDMAVACAVLVIKPLTNY